MLMSQKAATKLNKNFRFYQDMNFKQRQKNIRLKKKQVQIIYLKKQVLSNFFVLFII